MTSSTNNRLLLNTNKLFEQKLLDSAEPLLGLRAPPLQLTIKHFHTVVHYGYQSKKFMHRHYGVKQLFKHASTL